MNLLLLLFLSLSICESRLLSSDTESGSSAWDDRQNFEVIPLEGYRTEKYKFPVVMTAPAFIGNPPQEVKVAVMTGYSFVELQCDNKKEGYYQQSKSTEAENVQFDKKHCNHDATVDNEKHVCGYKAYVARGETIVGHMVKDKIFFGDLTRDDKDDIIKYGVKMQFACQTSSTAKSNFPDIHGYIGLKTLVKKNWLFPQSYIEKLTTKHHFKHNMFSLCFSTYKCSDALCGKGRLILGGYHSKYHTSPLRYTPIVNRSSSHYFSPYEIHMVGVSMVEQGQGEVHKTHIIWASNEASNVVSKQPIGTVLNSESPIIVMPRDIVLSIRKILLEVCNKNKCGIEMNHVEEGTDCFKVTDSKKLHNWGEEYEKFPILQFAFPGMEVKMLPEDYLYPHNTKEMLCLNIYEGNVFSGWTAVLGIRFFQNRDIVYDPELSLIGIADADCTPNVTKENHSTISSELIEGEQQISSADDGVYRYFHFNIKDEADSNVQDLPLIVALTALDGDPDMYISWSTDRPTKAKYDEKSNWNEKLEHLRIEPEKIKEKKIKRISIGVLGYAKSTKFGLVVFRHNAVSLLDGQPMIGFTHNKVPMHYLFTVSSTNKHDIEFTLIPVTGKVDMYLSASQSKYDRATNVVSSEWPTKDNYKKSSVNPDMEDDYIPVDSNDAIHSVNQKSGTYLLSIYPTDDETKYSSFKVIASTTASTTALQDGVPGRYQVEWNSYRYFSFYASKPGTSVNIDVTSDGSGDPDIFVGCRIKPTGTDDGLPSSQKNHSKWSSTWNGPDSVLIPGEESCASDSRVFYIAVKGFRAGTFTILASTTDGPLVTLRDNIPQQGFAVAGRYRYFKYSIPKDAKKAMIYTTSSNLASFSMFITDRDIQTKLSNENVDSGNCAYLPAPKQGESCQDACRCSQFGAKGAFGVSPGCAHHTLETNAPNDEFCYVKIPEECDNAQNSAMNSKNKFIKCDPKKFMKYQLPIYESSDTYDWSGMENPLKMLFYLFTIMSIGDGRNDILVSPGTRRNQNGNQNSFGENKELTIGVKGLVSTAFTITVKADGSTEKKDKVTSLTNGQMSPSQLVKKDETVYYKFKYSGDNHPQQGGLDISASLSRGSVSIYVVKGNNVIDVVSKAEWKSTDSSSGLFIAKKNSCSRPPATDKCNKENIFEKDTYFKIAVTASQDSVFAVTATLVNDPVMLTTGKMQYRALGELIPNWFGALFEYKASASMRTESLVVDLSNLPALPEGEYCSLKVYLLKCEATANVCEKEKFLANPQLLDAHKWVEYDVEPNKKKVTSLEDTFEGTYYVSLVANWERGSSCEHKLSFHIGFLSSYFPNVIQPSCFTKPSSKHLCVVGDSTSTTTETKGAELSSRKDAVVKLVEDDLAISFQVCKGDIQFAVCPVELEPSASGSRSDCNKPETPNDSVNGDHFLSKSNSGMHYKLYKKDKLKTLKTYFIGVRNLDPETSRYHLEIVNTEEDDGMLLSPSDLTVETQSDSVKVSLNPKTRNDASSKLNKDGIVYDLFWWEYSPAESASYASNIFDTPCGLRVLRDDHPGKVFEKRDVDFSKGEFTLKGLSPGKQYFVNVVLRCEAGDKCGSGIPPHSVAYHPKYFTTPAEKSQGRYGWFIFMLVIAGALFLVLLIPGLAYLKKLYNERKALKQQLRYEMQDVRNMARSGGLEPISTVDLDDTGISLRNRAKETEESGLLEDIGNSNQEYEVI